MDSVKLNFFTIALLVNLNIYIYFTDAFTRADCSDAYEFGCGPLGERIAAVRYHIIDYI